MTNLLGVIASIIIGVVASFIASKMFLAHNNKRNNPIIKISDKLIHSQRIDGTASLNIKLINKTKQDITDISITLEGFDNSSPQGHIPLLRLFHISSRNLIYIKKFNVNDANAEYAHRTHLFVKNSDIQKEILKHKNLRISITANCPYYGTATILTKDYNTQDDILEDTYHFNTGDSLSVSS
ncbi:hypothetical protein SPONN_586 [uncultured Candidatus Thioglobus sp.]|nr:hypothetical protein SPONL_1164 [uncultured Candidatus Thioglobus sp.]SMM99433.1 hypothetical protein SPONN_586 [uncultured Candidatus Thioglobus sp.]